MVGCHHWLDGHEFEQAPGGGEGQGGLACCSPPGSSIYGISQARVLEWGAIAFSEIIYSNILIVEICIREKPRRNT